MARRNGEILAPVPARLPIARPPTVWQEYPKSLQHPQGDEHKLLPVIVYTWDQEQQYLAKGYEALGTGDPFGFLTSKATEKTDDAVRLMNKNAAERMAEMRADIRDAVREETLAAIEQINQVIDEMRPAYRRVAEIDKELARIRGKMLAIDNDVRKLMGAVAGIMDAVSALRSKPKSWWRRMIYG